jgi:hypothetical protein
MNGQNPFQPPRGHRAPARFDPERAQRFANWMTALALVALASIAGSLAVVDAGAWLTRGRGHQVGDVGLLVMLGTAALVLVLVAQQLGPTLKSRGRIAVVSLLVASTIAGPLLAALHTLG